MMFGSWNRKKAIEVKILSLQQAREESKKKIRALRIQMDGLVKQALDGDDLDKKILSLDYMNKKGELSLESERFEDLSTLISRLQGIQSTGEKLKRLGHVSALHDTLDMKTILQEKDMVSIRRSLLEEEEAEYENLYDTKKSDMTSFHIAPEFEQLLCDAASKTQTPPVFTEQIEL